MGGGGAAPQPPLLEASYMPCAHSGERDRGTHGVMAEFRLPHLLSVSKPQTISQQKAHDPFRAWSDCILKISSLAKVFGPSEEIE